MGHPGMKDYARKLEIVEESKYPPVWLAWIVVSAAVILPSACAVGYAMQH